VGGHLPRVVLDSCSANAIVEVERGIRWTLYGLKEILPVESGSLPWEVAHKRERAFD